MQILNFTALLIILLLLLLLIFRSLKISCKPFIPEEIQVAFFFQEKYIN